MTTAKKAKPAAEAPAKARKPRVEVHEILLAFLSGEDAVRKLHAEKKIGRNTFRKAVSALDGNNLKDQAHKLAAMSAEFYPRAGRVMDGMRLYTVQRLEKDANPWIRLPLHNWNVEKGAQVVAAFEDDKIVIKMT